MKRSDNQLWLLLAMIFPFFLIIQIIHEGAHWTVGTLSGLDCAISISPITGGRCLCNGIPDNVAWFFAAGGITAAVVAVTPLAFRKIRNYKPLVICCLSIGFSELVGAAAETFDHQNYVSDSLFWPIILNGIFVVLFLTLTLTMLGKNSQFLQKIGG
tara:strand:- start:2208 stop:2678 length:471 start_codon:yes stop_codon:yes gene_type:complete